MPLGGGRIFVLTSGMLNENTASHEMALRLLPETRHAILFVGYTDPDSPGGRLRASVPKAPFVLSADAGTQTRKCEVHHFDLTAHAYRADLLAFAEKVAPKNIILGHGDPPAQAWFAEQIAIKMPKTKVWRPKPGETMTI
jgi:Cft2 family RNA processing exonuclease